MRRDFRIRINRSFHFWHSPPASRRCTHAQVAITVDSRDHRCGVRISHQHLTKRDFCLRLGAHRAFLLTQTNGYGRWYRFCAKRKIRPANKFILLITHVKCILIESCALNIDASSPMAPRKVWCGSICSNIRGIVCERPTTITATSKPILYYHCSWNNWLEITGRWWRRMHSDLSLVICLPSCGVRIVSSAGVYKLY